MTYPFVSECSRNEYKDSSGNRKCTPCPDKSHSSVEGATMCSCWEDYYRAPGEPVSMSCGTAPDAPLNVTYQVEGTHVRLSWRRPESDGNRNEIFYKIQCATCNQGPKYMPSYLAESADHIRGTSINVTGLEPRTDYMFQISAMNSITEAKLARSSFSTASFKTDEDR